MRTFVRNILILLIILIGATGHINAFSLDTYASSSVLSEGRWVKVSVSETGLHFISTSTLRSWGFSDPAAVRIFGYGGERISDQLTRDLYVDDLPPVRFEQTTGGIVFFAKGPGTWTAKASGEFTHSLNPYSTVGYYYLTDSRPDTDASIPTEGSGPTANAATTFTERLYHESEISTPAESGHQLVGEDFRFTPKRTFNFPLTGRVEGTEVWMQCEFFAKSASDAVRLTFTANGETLPSVSSDCVNATSEWGNTATITKTFIPQGSTLSLGIAISISSPVSLANLDRIAINYTRSLSLPASGNLLFTSSTRSLKLAGAKASTHVWDVTDPNRPIAMPVSEGTDGTAGWTNDYNGLRSYAAWTTTASMPAPRLVGKVANQNIHGEDTPDMVIISPSQLLEQSRRIADLHANGIDSLKVLVVTDEHVYNEFGSGAPDVNALRRMLKMFYDRGFSASSSSKLKYVLLMGGAHHDHRRLTSAMTASSIITLPIWQTDLCNSELSSYCTDDFITFLEDNSGLRMSTDAMSIAVGRIPARSVSAAKCYVDRLISYTRNPLQNEWRNRIFMYADEGNLAEHMVQSDTFESNARAVVSDRDLTFHKVYIDAYELRNGTSAEAKTKVSTLFNDGVVLWTYIGHGALNNLSGDGIFTPSYLNSLYLRYPTFFYGATCSFGQFDGNSTSGVESFILTDEGGGIGGLTAVRPVYIVRNGILTAALGTEMFSRAEDGNYRSVGEIIRRSKNATMPDDNIRRYVLFCDPALRLAIPSNNVRILTVDGKEVTSDSQPTLAALSRTSLTGEICDPNGKRLENFNGWVSLSLYDAERSITTLGRGDKDQGRQHTFEEQGERLYAGRANVVNGFFEAVIAMPGEIADNFRPATLSMFAAAETGEEATGVCRDLYAYGLDENAAPDDVAPVIEYLYLNHESFKQNDVVDATPMLIARVSDDVALNMSAAGVGHQMTIRIDGDKNYTDVSSRFTPDNDGTPAGTILYQLPELAAGNHTATLKVWDTGGNSASASLDFFVDPNIAPKIFDVYSDANPATTEANFYVSHNRPEATLTVKIEVIDLGGNHIWSSETRGRADMYTSSPVTWNLTNSAGSRVARGIYLYRTTVSSGGESSTLTKRIAVAPH
ncbi:MAG: type IX secretion system sortase PorU [Staphylococcus sp.]|nr:type IX secretion system sortase PorU [Staphylococcus sp.]